MRITVIDVRNFVFTWTFWTICCSVTFGFLKDRDIKMDKKSTIITNNNCLQRIFIACVASGCYYNTLHGGFVFDDVEAIIKNTDVRWNSPLLNVFNNDFWGTRITRNVSHKSYRPITVLTYKLDNYLSENSGQNDAYYFHLTNIFLYAVVCVISLSVFKMFLEDKSTKVEFRSMSLLACLLFTVHPVHVECVSAIVGRADLLCALTYWCTLLCYRSAVSFQLGRSYQCAILSYLFSVLLTVLATFCKETGITVLAMCSLYDLTTSRKKLFDAIKYSIPVFKIRSYENDLSVDVKNIFIRHAGLLITGLLTLYFRWKVMNFEEPVFQKTDNPASFSNNIFTRIYTYNYLYSLNALLLVWPHWLCFDWSMDCVSLISSLADLRMISIVLFWSVAMMFIYKIIHTPNKGLQRKLLFGVCLTIIPFLPASNIFLRVGFVIAERALFICSAGFCIIIIVGMEKLMMHYSYYRKIILFFYCVVLVAFIMKTMHRTEEWTSEEKLFYSAAPVCPNNAKVHYNIAKVATDKNQSALAEAEYRLAIRLYPEYDQAMNNLANLIREYGKLSEAELLLRQAIQIRPDFAAAWMNLGIVLSNLNKTGEAELCYKTALRHRQKYADCYYNLGNLYLGQKRYEEAISTWRKAISIKPTLIVAWSNLLVLLDSLGKTDEVISIAQEALTVLPNEAVLHFNLANSLGKAKKWLEAEKSFKSAINLCPTNPLYYSNLGVLYHRWKKYSEAKYYYEAALKIDPNLKSAKNNLLKLQ